MQRSRQSGLARQRSLSQRLGDQLFVAAVVEHRGHEIVGERGDRRDPRQGVLVVPAEPARQFGVASAALQARIAADELDLVQKNTPAGEADRGKETRRKSEPLTRKIGFARRLDVEQFGRPVVAKPGLHGRQAEFAAAEKAGDARVILGRKARDQPEQGGEHRRQRPRARLLGRPGTRGGRKAPRRASAARAPPSSRRRFRRAPPRRGSPPRTAARDRRAASPCSPARG